MPAAQRFDDGNVTISLDVLGLGTVPIVDIVGVFDSDAEVTGPCGAGGGNTLNPAASSNIVSAGVSVMGQSIGVSDGSALQNFNVGTDVSALADVLGIVGSSVDVTGTLTLNATNTSAAAGMGIADATSLLLDIDVNFDLLGAIGSDVLNILVEISASDTDMDCMSSPVELQQFEVL